LNFKVPNHFLSNFFRKITLVMFFEMFDTIETLEEVLAVKAQAI
jgi:hypothetical protein